ncbi:MAG: collagen-like triple helix repeat-containing protein [Cetobacterium sp.]
MTDEASLVVVNYAVEVRTVHVQYVDDVAEVVVIPDTSGVASVSVAVRGPQGPQGLPGTPGTAGVTETGPALTYAGGLLTRIDYDSGNYKTLSYISGVLNQLDYIVDGTTTRKTFNYTSGVLTSIDEVII